MTQKLLVFGASNSRNSINRQLAESIAKAIQQVVSKSKDVGKVNLELDFIDLNDFEMPIYSPEREHDSGIPERAQLFRKKVSESFGIVISFAEYNGSYTSAFKNIFDWSSRIEGSCWQEKAMFLAAASPGSRGGASVLEQATSRFPFMGAVEIVSFSLPFFEKNFQDGIIQDESLAKKLEEQVRTYSKLLIQ